MSEAIRVSGKKYKAPGAREAAVKLIARPGGWWIAEFPDGSRQRIAFQESRGHFSASLHGHLIHGSVNSDRSSSHAAGGGDSDLVAQFPGKIRKILVTAGSQVKGGEPLVLVEAMKMEFTIKAPGDGKVDRILVTEGQQISPGDRFVEFLETEAESE